MPEWLQITLLILAAVSEVALVIYMFVVRPHRRARLVPGTGKQTMSFSFTEPEVQWSSYCTSGTMPAWGVQVRIARGLQSEVIVDDLSFLLGRLPWSLRNQARGMTFVFSNQPHPTPGVLATYYGDQSAIVFWKGPQTSLILGVLAHELAHALAHTYCGYQPDGMGVPRRVRDSYAAARERDAQHGAELVARGRLGEPWSARTVSGLRRQISPTSPWINDYAAQQDDERTRSSEDFAEAVGHFVVDRRRWSYLPASQGVRRLRFADLHPHRAAVVAEALAPPEWARYKLRFHRNRKSPGWNLYAGPYCLRPALLEDFGSGIMHDGYLLLLNMRSRRRRLIATPGRWVSNQVARVSRLRNAVIRRVRSTEAVI